MHARLRESFASPVRTAGARRIAAASLATLLLSLSLALAAPGAMAIDLATSPISSAASAAPLQPSLSDAARRGALRYDGRVALRARLLGHERDLPAVATACANCHDPRAAAPRTPPSGASAAAQRRNEENLGPALDAASLIGLRARRGGPPSRFDAVSLCTLLRTGLDPAQILIPQAMPRYAVSDADCRDLWAYLYERTSN